MNKKRKISFYLLVPFKANRGKHALFVTNGEQFLLVEEASPFRQLALHYRLQRDAVSAAQRLILPALEDHQELKPEVLVMKTPRIRVAHITKQGAAT